MTVRIVCWHIGQRSAGQFGPNDIVSGRPRNPSPVTIRKPSEIRIPNSVLAWARSDVLKRRNKTRRTIGASAFNIVISRKRKVLEVGMRIV